MNQYTITPEVRATLPPVEEYERRLVGNVILVFKEYLRVEGVKQADAARRMGILPQSLCRILSGKGNPTVHTLGLLLHEAHFYPRLVPVESPKRKGVE